MNAAQHAQINIEANEKTAFCEAILAELVVPTLPTPSRPFALSFRQGRHAELSPYSNEYTNPPWLDSETTLCPGCFLDFFKMRLADHRSSSEASNIDDPSWRT